MNARTRTRTLAIAIAVAAASACQDKKNGIADSTASSFIQVTASASQVVANGSNKVTLTVTNTAGGTVTVTTTRGTFEPTGLATATVSGASTQVGLVTCSASTPGCVGNAVVTASGSAGTSTVTVAFNSVAAACQTDCTADPGCPTLACSLPGGGSGACSSSSPSTCVAGSACTPTPAGAVSETSCSDGVDNDCNGSKDCAETTCDGQPCLAGSPTFLCKSNKCTDIASGLAVTIAPVLDRLPANGTTQTEVAVTVTSGTDPAPNLTISVSSTLGTILPAAAATDASGVAKFTFTSSATPGTATITATIASIPSVKGTAVITIPRLGSLRLVEATPGSVEFPVMGARSSGWQDFGWVQVMAVDDIGLPYPDGLQVEFVHHKLGGSALRGPLTDSATCAAPLCDRFLGAVASGTTPNTTGLASAWVYSGTVAGTLVVTATATAGGTTSTVSLPTLAVVGGKASGANFSVVCAPRNVPALAETTGGVSLVDAPFTCEALLKDRFNNVLGRSTQVIFMAEAGAVGQPTWTTPYDPTAPGNGQMNLGVAVQGVNTLGAGLPFDVAPDTTTSEPSWTEVVLDPQAGGTVALVHNPRDGVVTVVAIADGEEMFFDANGNGAYDLGESFIDQGEPYVDANDNGRYDPGEPFLDVDGNGAWTPPNTTWDGNTKIWTQTVVLYTGTSDTIALPGGTLLGTRIASPAVTSACTPSAPPATFDVFADTTTHPGGTSQGYTLFASDRNLNFLNAGTTYSVDLIPNSAIAKLTYFGLANYADLPGLTYRYWPCDANGQCASQCRATVGGGICHLVPLVSGYSCGLGTSLLLTGSGTAGSGTARWLVDVPWSEYQNQYTQHGGHSVGGIVRP